MESAVVIRTQLYFRDVSFDLLSGRNVDQAMSSALAEDVTDRNSAIAVMQVVSLYVR